MLLIFRYNNHTQIKTLVYNSTAHKVQKLDEKLVVMTDLFKHAYVINSK